MPVKASTGVDTRLIGSIVQARRMRRVHMGRAWVGCAVNRFSGTDFHISCLGANNRVILAGGLPGSRLTVNEDDLQPEGSLGGQSSLPQAPVPRKNAPLCIY